MTRRVAGSMLSLLFVLPACGPRDESKSTSLYGEGRTMPAGIVAAIRVDLERFGFSRMLELDLGDAAVLHVFELDRSTGGGGEAAVLSGPGAAELEDVLIERGYISRIDDDGTVVIGPPRTVDPEAAAGPLPPMASTAAGMFAPRPLRRFESDGRIVFSPTVDMKHDLLDLDATASAELETRPEVAIAFNGRRLARLLQSRFNEMLGPLGEMAAVELSRRTRGRRSMRSRSDLAFSALAGIRSGRLTYSADRGQLRIVVEDGSALAEFAAATRALDGEWPLFDEGGLKVAFACDVPSLALAVAGWSETDAPEVGLPRWWDGRFTGTFELDRTALTRVGVGTHADVAGPATADEWSEFAAIGLAVGESAVTVNGWALRPGPPAVLRWGRLGVQSGTFLHVRDGKIPTESARTILTGKRVEDDTLEFDWFGLTP